MTSVPEFEFESPSDSPAHYLNQPNDSPADLFFIKGRLVPHVFKVQDNTKNGTTRRCSSLNSDGGGGKESMISWSSGKATFTNRSSSSRTSSIENTSTERNLQENIHVMSSTTNYAYGSTQKLKFLTPAPVLNNGAVKKKNILEIRVVDYLEVKKEVKECKGRKSGFRKRLFWLFCFPVESSTAMDVYHREEL